MCHFATSICECIIYLKPGHFNFIYLIIIQYDKACINSLPDPSHFCESGLLWLVRLYRVDITSYGIPFVYLLSIPDATWHHTWRSRLWRSYTTVLAYNPILETMKVWKWGYAQGDHGPISEFCTVKPSRSHLLWDEAVKQLMRKLSEPFSQLWQATVSLGEPSTHNSFFI